MQSRPRCPQRVNIPSVTGQKKKKQHLSGLRNVLCNGKSIRPYRKNYYTVSLFLDFFRDVRIGSREKPTFQKTFDANILYINTFFFCMFIRILTLLYIFQLGSLFQETRWDDAMTSRSPKSRI